MDRIYEMLKKNAVCGRDGGVVPSVKDSVNLNGWFNFEHETNNIGDLLGPVVVEECKKYYGIHGNKCKGTKHLYTVGSVLMGWQDATYWGSGFLRDVTTSNAFPIYAALHKVWHKTDIRAVRGPRYKAILEKMKIQCPDTFGDPALLMPRFYKPKNVAHCDYIVVPHYNDIRYYYELYPDRVLPTFVRDYKEFIDTLNSAELIISSSLHGIILAEAYGIPAILLKNRTIQLVLST